MINRSNWLATQDFLQDMVETNPNISQKTIRLYRFYLKHFLTWAGEQAFDRALEIKRPKYPAYVASLKARRGEGKLSLEAQKKIILVAKKFLDWAWESKLPGTKKISRKHINSMTHVKIIRSGMDPVYASLDDVIALLKFDFGDSLVIKRDIAALCFAFLSGARASAIAYAPIKAIDLQQGIFRQDASIGVRTKNGVSEVTYFLPIPELYEKVKEWDVIVRSKMPEDSPWFAVLENEWGDVRFSDTPPGENRGLALQKRFRNLYKLAGMANRYKSPHKFRHGHAVYGLQHCDTMAKYQALSRNLMHSSLVITDKIYAVVERDERKNAIASLQSNPKMTQPETDRPSQDQIMAVVKYLNQMVGGV